MINHLHGSDFYDFLHHSPKWYQKILFYTYNKVDVSIVLLESMKKEFRDFEDMRVEVVQNFYDKELDEKLVEKDKDKINLVYLSNIISSKGIFELIDAFEKLSKKYENIYLRIAGGFMSDELMDIKEVKKKFTLKIKNNNRIIYLGKVFGKEKVKLLQQSNIFVLPTYYKSEAFPISIIEAMRCGNAIVATKYKYLPEVVKSKNGILVKAKSVDSLVYGIYTLLEDHNLLENMQEYNKKEAQENYSLQKYIDSLSKIVLGKV
jgi:glycosyltransferase involved in cell wall biosynthesis